ncbi:unnamed protein product [Lathyrus oleraceus]|uniref:Myb-like domain-containing protein n=1 Tax=Pisum sativum TaxID=3888 RepID=A0A9D4W8A6_PEA|nr:uncharacterized protein LOC127092074 [Pisum sativum]KAI5396798.1 hypothetical protein KIW84_062863 [Pisum sativum]
MDGKDEPHSSLPWHWIIESLAGFKETPLSTLQGLIDAAPIRHDDFCENTKELVALRCLEELYAPFSSSTLDSSVELDSSRSCEDVLREILHEVPLSNLRIAGGKLLKWDVNPFITDKRAGNVKCHLEKLKESILEGTLPLTDHLKERSGLFQTNRNRPHTVCVNDGKCNDHSVKDDGNSTYAEDMGAKENSVSIVLEDGNKSSKEDLPNNKRLSSKRNRVYSADKHLMSCFNEKQACINERDELLTTKKIKHWASTNFDSKKEKQVSRLEKEVSENSTEKVLISESVGHHTEKKNREAKSGGSLEPSYNRCSASNMCQSSGQNEAFHAESDIAYKATLTPQQKTSGGKPQSEHELDLQLKDLNCSQQTASSVKAQDDTGNGCGIEIPGDTVVYPGEKINLVMKKHKKRSLDTKCSEGGRLPVCEAVTGPLLVPESCIGMTTNIYPQHTSGVDPSHNKYIDETNYTVHVEPIPTYDGNAIKIQHITNQSQIQQKEPNVASLNVSRKPVANDKVVVDTVNDCVAELSNDSDEYHNEKIDLVAKKDEFLNSQHTFGQDLPAKTESTRQNLCMKCNEAGQLLVCKTTTCSLMVHKNCLGASAQLDAKGNFFCPFCAYSHTISEYLEAKKIASLARKELAIFISKGIRKEAVEHVYESGRQECIFSRKSYKCEHTPLAVNEENREDHAGEHANKVGNFPFERSQQQVPILVVHSSSFREKENVNNGLVGDVREEDDCEMLNAKSLTDERVEDREMGTDNVGGHGNEIFSSKKLKIVCANESNEEVLQNMTEHSMDGTVEPVWAHNTVRDEISKDECKKRIISRYSMRFRMHEVQNKIQESPQIRRKKIPWTAEEEELIQEGVQKFGFSDSKLPWKKILAFGSHLFEKNDRLRTPQDLKDKWKNMCKAHSKLK